MIFFSFPFNFSLSELVLPQNHRFPIFYIQSWGSFSTHGFHFSTHSSPAVCPWDSTLPCHETAANSGASLLALTFPRAFPVTHHTPPKMGLSQVLGAHTCSVLLLHLCCSHSSICHFIILPLDADPQSSLGAVQGLLCNLHTLLNHLRHICHFNYNLF